MSLLGPTPERVAKAAGGVDVPVVDTKRRRNAFRVVGIVETMLREGRLRPEQAAAFRKWERDMAVAHSSSALLSRYGELTGSGGTPLSQLASDLLSPEERRTDAHRSLAQAAISVGEPRTVEVLIMLATTDATLEQIGRHVLMVGNRPQAKAQAERTIQLGTYWLARHYGFVHHDPG